VVNEFRGFLLKTNALALHPKTNNVWILNQPGNIYGDKLLIYNPSGEKVKELGVKPLARFVTYAVGGVPPGIMGIGPVEAIPKALKRAGLKVQDMDIVELNEAFACQALAVIRQLSLPRERVNVNGGAVALGHPLGATGAKLTVSILHELRRRNGRYGLVTMCVGGGMGGAGIFEMCR